MWFFFFCFLLRVTNPEANSFSPFNCSLHDSVKVMDAQSLEVIQEIAVKDIVEIDFSPKGTFLSTWMRQSKQTHKGEQEESNRQEGGERGSYHGNNELNVCLHKRGGLDEE